MTHRNVDVAKRHKKAKKDGQAKRHDIGSVVRAAYFHSPQQDRPTEASQCNRRQHPRLDLSIRLTTERQPCYFLSVAPSTSTVRATRRFKTGEMPKKHPSHLDHLWGKVIQGAAQSVAPRVGGVDAPPEVGQLQAPRRPDQQILGLRCAKDRIFTTTSVNDGHMIGERRRYGSRGGERISIASHKREAAKRGQERQMQT